MATANSSTFFSTLPSFIDDAGCTTRPQMPHRTSSAAHHALMRQIMQPWGSLSSTPPGCAAVSFSSWRRFSASSAKPKTPEEMKASVLLKACGTTPDYDPPLLERTNLGIDQSVVQCGKPKVPKMRQQHKGNEKRKGSSLSSWTTAMSSEGSSVQDAMETEPIVFHKETFRKTPTSSLLTTGFKEVEVVQEKAEKKPKITEEMAREFGVERLSISCLDEDAFESDSEEDE